MIRRLAAFVIAAALLAAPSLGHAQITPDLAVTRALAGARTTQEKAQAIVNLLRGQDRNTVAAIAAELVAQGDAAVIATVVNAEAASGLPGGASAVAAISAALGQSTDGGKVASVLGSVSSGVQSSVAGMVKAAATAANNNAVLSIATVSAATAPVAVVTFTPPPPLVVNPNQVAGSPS